jgi:hypothetical protein
MQVLIAAVKIELQMAALRTEPHREGKLSAADAVGAKRRKGNQPVRHGLFFDRSQKDCSLLTSSLFWLSRIMTIDELCDAWRT